MHILGILLFSTQYDVIILKKGVFKVNNYNYNNYNYNFVNNTPNKKSKSLLKATSNKIGGALILLSVLFYGVSFGLAIIFALLNIDFYSDDTIYYLMSGIVSILGMMLPAVLLISTIKEPIANLIKVKKVPLVKLTTLVFAGLSICMVANLAVNLLNINLSALGIDNTVEFHEEACDVLGIIVNIFVVAITPALVEEFLFRGAILGSLRKFGDSFAILASATLFGLCHGNFVQIPFAFIVGLVLAFVTVRSGSIIPAIIIHLLNNFYSVILGIANNNFSQEIFYAIIIGFTLLILIAGVISFINLTKREENLFHVNSNGTECLNITFKQKMVSFLTAPCMIIGIVLFVLEAIMVYIK